MNAPASPARAQGARAFEGLTWAGFGLVALVCVLNGVRRSVMGVSAETFATAPAALDWLSTTAWLVAHGALVALPIVFAVVAAYNLAPQRAWGRNVVLALTLAVASFGGVALSFAVDYVAKCPGEELICDGADAWMSDFIAAWSRYGALSALFAVVFVYLRDADASGARAQAADVDRNRFVQRMDEARLRMLQAQIEPHFLFNTLANVRRLYQVAPADAATMLDHLMRYLQGALPHMRAASSTLAREVELTRAYLELQRIRMGPRLAFDIAVPETLGDTALPPMMLVTLAENAIKHGLAPLPEGGRIGISVDVHAGEMSVRVADTGQGFTQTSGGGTGLANIRARLAAMYGPAGRLSLALNAPRGVVATIAVPFPSPSSRAAA